MQLNITKTHVNNLMKDLLAETKRFKYQITFQITSQKKKKKKKLSRAQKVISKYSGWMIESVDGIYINIFFYNPLAGSSYIKLPEELRKSRKILINIKKKR